MLKRPFSMMAKLAQIAVRPRCWPALAQGVAATVEHAKALDNYEFSTIVDVGANKGQFATYASSRWPSARLICFEPLPNPRDKLKRIVGSKAQIHDCALGATTGVGSMHLASREDSSSLLPLGDAQKSIFGMSELSQLPVSIRRLDDTISEPLTRPILLKIDVQGFELEVLKGASKLLKYIDYIYAEISHVELYKGQALDVEVNSYLVDAGFVNAGTFNAQYDKGNLVQADVLFSRTIET